MIPCLSPSPSGGGPGRGRAALKAISLAVCVSLTACSVAPKSTGAPPVDTPVAFKEGQGEWVKAAPADALQRGPWWQLFGDPVLDELAARVQVSNQNVAAAVAAYQQARALTAQQRASLFPAVTLNGSGSRSGSRGGSTTTTASGAVVTTGGAERNSFQFTIGASWEPDVFGRLSGQVAAASASEQASQADLASATLAAQGELVANYINLRGIDAQRRLLARTVEGFKRALQIATNRYNAGVVARTDVLQAQTSLANAQGDLLGLEQQRAQLEHAIAVLVGRAPGNFSLPPKDDWSIRVPDVPLAVPSTLLQRRPDIASAERRVAQANEQIGIATTGYFPSFRLTGSAGQSAAAIGDLFSASSLFWSLGLSAAQTLFNAGLTRAQVEAARAAYEQQAARYRQTVLTAFQGVEDQLVASRVLGEQFAFREEASRNADLVEQQVLNRYQAGQVSFTEVVNAQATALSARRALVQLQSSRSVAAVSLIQALGGGWAGLTPSPSGGG